MTFGRLHLKAVEIFGIGARCVGLKFVTGLVQFLLKHARVLPEGSTTSGRSLNYFYRTKDSLQMLWFCSPEDLSEFS
ncbi:hypothetical protein CFP56_022493 [Quercus suber]|uniref:Uncharacterized protein n=1 Tax=Quercus suber TaxID=58331 RepID=A0AAW0KBA4_QUESU